MAKGYFDGKVLEYAKRNLRKSEEFSERLQAAIPKIYI